MPAIEHRDLIAQVVPDLATFAVDDGFSYAVPVGMDRISIGSVVRIPLGARRIRGHVVSLRYGDATGLKDIVGISGDHPVFDDDLLQTLRWAALHYVAPVSVLLGRAGPPNLPRGKGKPPIAEIPALDSVIPTVSSAAAQGLHWRPICLVAQAPYCSMIAGAARQALAAGRNAAVVAPTIDEARGLFDSLRETFGERVMYVSSAVPAKEATQVWVNALSHGGYIIVGTPEVALWPLGSPALWFIVEDGRRAMKAKQTPTLQVRDLVRRRALIERTSVVFLGPVPTLDTLAKGAETLEFAGRSWPLVELVDRREDAPSGRSLSPIAVQAIRATIKDGGQVFVFVSRRGYAPAFRCVSCRELRRCPECGSGPDRGDACRRCGAQLGACVECGGRRFEPLGAALGGVGEELRRRLGDGVVGTIESRRQVLVGTERDLPYVPETALTVAVDADALLMAPHYRAEEDAVRILVRVVSSVARGRGNRCLIQTAQPTHRAFGMLRSGHPLEYLDEIEAERESDGLPPAASLLSVEVAGDAAARSADIETLATEGIQLHGPEYGGGRTRWFLQGQNLQTARVQLRSVVQHWRDAGLKVRIDADPIDL